MPACPNTCYEAQFLISLPQSALSHLVATPPCSIMSGDDQPARKKQKTRHGDDDTGTGVVPTGSASADAVKGTRCFTGECGNFLLRGSNTKFCSDCNGMLRIARKCFYQFDVKRSYWALLRDKELLREFMVDAREVGARYETVSCLEPFLCESDLERPTIQAQLPVLTINAEHTHTTWYASPAEYEEALAAAAGAAGSSQLMGE